MTQQALKITALGAQGDGIAGGVFVPFGLPDETVEADVEKGRASNVCWTNKSAERIDPACSHFGDCGGCKTQHMSPALYQRWKAGLVEEALKQAGIDVALQPLVSCAPKSRRRVTFSVVVTDGGVVVGFQRSGTNHVVALNECHVITPTLDKARGLIGQLTKLFLPKGKTASIAVLDSQSGLDISVVGSFKLDGAARRSVCDFAVKTKIARIAINGETIIENKRPLLNLSGFTVSAPSGGFVQAVKSIENEMVAQVCAHLSKCRRVADLFSGSGTFSLPLSRNSSVYAAEGQEEALTALDRAWREASTQGLKPVKIEKRDLHNRPMMAKELELAKIQGVVFDPPRAGAEMQAKELAKSKVKRIAAVSCNPVTLARDLRILIDGGYTLQTVTPLDQFLWSPHVETVALLVRGKG